LRKEEFKEIYNQHAKAIRSYLYYRSGNEEIANDLTQDTFVKLWEGNYLIKENKTKALLYKVAGGLFIDYIRREKTQADYISHFKFKLKESSENIENALENRQECELALQALTEKERTVFLMNKMEGYKYKEISEFLEISVKAVEKRMSSALKKLKSK
jgi:RNA polymerase sigma-70 factor (ECF subfamily)